MTAVFYTIKSSIIFKFVKIYYKKLILAIGLSIVGGACGAVIITLIGKESGERGTIFVPIAYIASCLVMMGARSLSEIFLMKISQAIVIDLRMHISRKIISTHLSVLRDIGKASLLSTITEDVGVISSSFSWIPELASNVFVLLACVVCMSFVSWKISIFLIFCMILGGGTFYSLQKGPLRQMAVIRAKGDILFKNFRDLIDGVRELQINSERGDFFVNRLIYDNAASLRRDSFANSKKLVLINNVSGVFFYGVIGVIVFLFPLFLKDSAHSVFMATLIAMYSVGPVNVIIGSFNTFGRLQIALGRIGGIDGRLNTDLFLEGDSRLFDGAGGNFVLEMRDVAYSYPLDKSEDGFKLGPISFRARSGEVLFFVGGNGSGKTTLSMLMLGLYEQESGRISLNGVEVHSANRTGYRQNFSAVLSDFHLFEHVGLGGSGSLGEAEAYIREFGLSDKICVENGKFSTIDLSSGQRRRLALISAYLEDRPIYLFDEWAADQDPEFKGIFYNEIIPDLKRRGKIVLVITHDDRYFTCADRVIGLESGRIKEYFDA